MSDQNIHIHVTGGDKGSKSGWPHPGTFFVWCGVVLLVLRGLSWLFGG
jgi:hypothetical protein